MIFTLTGNSFKDDDYLPNDFILSAEFGFGCAGGRRSLTLIKGILEGVLDQQQDDFDNMPKDVQNDEEGQRAEEVVDALDQAAACCDDAISACEQVLRGLAPA